MIYLVLAGGKATRFPGKLHKRLYNTKTLLENTLDRLEGKEYFILGNEDTSKYQNNLIFPQNGTAGAIKSFCDAKDAWKEEITVVPADAFFDKDFKIPNMNVNSCLVAKNKVNINQKLGFIQKNKYLEGNVALEAWVSTGIYSFYPKDLIKLSEATRLEDCLDNIYFDAVQYNGDWTDLGVEHNGLWMGNKVYLYPGGVITEELWAQLFIDQEYQGIEYIYGDLIQYQMKVNMTDYPLIFNSKIKHYGYI